ncbi:universal stress protein [Methanotorris igneus]|uniref:UspA domain-containing protein n=1 Tax=Methanotorris igneus (strain DSM 5666 / JCM 11834 / Kol 5) TaxID=880724 RepID=F6BEC3_METIK|nr:universal stress protein [Methanotorris igneus]AEF96800.1 UspA domain-containing protein [Methanotorris igneus Kol 5]
MLYKKIVVPTDGSDVSIEAAKHAIEIGKLMKAEIYVIYVVDIAPFIGLPTEGLWETMKEILNEEGEKALKKIKKMAEEHGVNVKPEILEGVPANEIVEFAEKKRADLIVMGTSGKTGLDRFLLGSVAEKVIRNAHCPVLVVKKQKKEEKEE